MKNRNEALNDFVKMTKQSWTYEKMTKEEKQNLLFMFVSGRTQEALKGNYNQRWEILQAIYNAFLQGLGYNGFNWREEN